MQLAKDHDHDQSYRYDSFFSLIQEQAISIMPVGDAGNGTVLVRGPGSGHSRVHTCIMITPSEKQSSFLVYIGGSFSASGGMYASVPGHMVRGVMLGAVPASLDMPKSVTLALLLAMINTLLLERSRWMMSLEWR